MVGTTWKLRSFEYDDVRERYIEEIESWIDYRVEEYKEGKDYE